MIDSKATKINAGITIKEPSVGIRFGTDALLLADFAADAVSRGSCIDLGTGSGVIPLLLLASGSNADFVGLELQQKHAIAAEENSKANGFSERFRVIQGDASDFKTLFKSGSFDYCVTNPPYMKSDCGKSNDSIELSIARREISGGAHLFCKAASWCLKSGGQFFAVYRPDRLVNLFCAMRNNRIEPKRLRAVVPSVGKKPSLVLVEGKKDAREGLIYEKDLIIYTDESHSCETDEIKAIYARFGERK